jgi:hypothetical protein
MKMTGHHQFSKLRDAMSQERQAANTAATEKTIADAKAFGSWLIANEGTLPDDFELDV